MTFVKYLLPYWGSAQEPIYAIYQNKSQLGFSGSTISFKKNNTFTFSSGTDVQQEFSSGIWRKIKDSFVLTSFLRKDDLPVTVKEITDNSKDSLTIDWVKNLNSYIFLDQKKYLLKSNRLYQLNEVYKKKDVRDSLNYIIEKSFFYTRMK